MKAMIVLVPLFFALSAPAYAQFGVVRRARQALDANEKLESLVLNGDEELRIGAAVSEKVRTRFGVVQDAAVHKYVTLVGRTLAEQSERPALDWTFIVLDTDGVNAFAAPGGFVHITRGALGLIKSEAELAAVLGHEIGHVAHEHTLNAIRKANAVDLASDAALADRGQFLDRVADFAYDSVLEGKFDRGDELDADSFAVGIARKLGYAPGMLADFLGKLAARNEASQERNGLFASHPETTERIDSIRKMAGPTSGAMVPARYGSAVQYESADITTVATITEGPNGPTGSSSDEQADPAPKRGFGLGALRRAVKPDQQSAQVSASGGSRGVGPDRLAKGGDNPALVTVTVTQAELAAFKQGIA